MTPELIRLQQNLHDSMRRFSLRQLYTIARALGDELTARQLDASLEARALECALLPLAAREQRDLFLTDGEEVLPRPPRGAIIGPNMPFCVLPPAEKS